MSSLLKIAASLLQDNQTPQEIVEEKERQRSLVLINLPEQQMTLQHLLNVLQLTPRRYKVYFISWGWSPIRVLFIGWVI